MYVIWNKFILFSLNFTFLFVKKKCYHVFCDNIPYFSMILTVFLIFMSTNFNYVQIFKSSKNLLVPYFILLSATLLIFFPNHMKLISLYYQYY